jgi:hypothetical protein
MRRSLERRVAGARAPVSPYLSRVGEPSSITLRAIDDDDIGRVAEFLHAHHNPGVSVSAWQSAMAPDWDCTQPNHGFLLDEDGRIVGAHIALYSTRLIDGRSETICNLGAWCVLPTHRNHGLRLLRALLAQKGYHFTDLSPSGNVVPLNLRLGFVQLDTATALIPNTPWPPASRGVRLVTDPDEIPRHLTEHDLVIHRNHAHAAAANHLVVVRGDQACYVIFRRDRRKGLPLFASLVYVSDPSLFRFTGNLVRRHLLLRHRIPFTLSELRIADSRPRLSIMLRSPRPKMYRSPTLRADDIDYLYSELTCLSW